MRTSRQQERHLSRPNEVQPPHQPQPTPLTAPLRKNPTIRYHGTGSDYPASEATTLNGIPSIKSDSDPLGSPNFSNDFAERVGEPIALGWVAAHRWSVYAGAIVTKNLFQ